MVIACRKTLQGKKKLCVKNCHLNVNNLGYSYTFATLKYLYTGYMVIMRISITLTSSFGSLTKETLNPYYFYILKSNKVYVSAFNSSFNC